MNEGKEEKEKKRETRDFFFAKSNTKYRKSKKRMGEGKTLQTKTYNIFGNDGENPNFQKNN